MEKISSIIANVELLTLMKLILSIKKCKRHLSLAFIGWFMVLIVFSSCKTTSVDVLHKKLDKSMCERYHKPRGRGGGVGGVGMKGDKISITSPLLFFPDYIILTGK